MRARIALALLVWGACDAQRLETVERIACGDVATAELARPSGAFLDSIGMNVALDSLAAGADATRTFDRLAELSVRHVRTGAWTLAKTDAAVLTELDRRGWRVLTQLSIDTDVPALLREQGERVEAVQVASPMNDIVASYPVSRLRESAAAVRDAVDRAPASPRPLVIAPLVWNSDDAQQVGNLSSFVDLGGFRASIGPVEPSRAFGEWTDLAFSVSGGKPLVATKGSWAGTGPPTPSFALSERRQARYVTRMLLENWNRGVVRTYADALDDPRCATEAFCYSGLIRADGTPKPAFLWWRALVTSLSSSPAMTSKRRLPLSIVAPSGADEVHHTLLEGAGGTLWLIVWLEVRGSDGDDVSRRVRLDVGLPLLTASALDLTSDATVPLAVGAPWELTVSDVPLVLRLQPACF